MKPTLCFLGPLVGRHPGHITTQDLVVADLFSDASFPVISASASLYRLIRLIEIVGTILKHRATINVAILSVYGGRSFVVEDTASSLCNLFRIPLVMVLHGGDMPNFMARYPSWTKRVLGRSDVLVAPSHYLSEAVKDHGFAALMIPNVIDLDKYPFRHRACAQPRLLWMRSFHQIYNPEMAVRVLADIRRRYPAARLVMAGQDKGSLHATQRLAIDLGVNDAIEFPGFLNMDQKVHFANTSDIFITTNRIDNMPVAVIEMCAMGLPVVSTSVGGIPHLLHHEETGLLVPGGDVEAMSHAIMRLIDTPSLVSTLSTNGRKLAEQSSWTNVRSQWEQLFEALIGNRRR